MTEKYDGASRHPSGWWKASDGKWYSPDEHPAEDSGTAADAAIATVIVLLAIVLGLFVPASAGNGNVALLLAGTAGAFATRWWIYGRPRHNWAR